MTGWSWEPLRQAGPPRDYSPRIYSDLLILREENTGGKILSEMVLFSVKLNFKSMFLNPPAPSPDKYLLLIYTPPSPLDVASPECPKALSLHGLSGLVSWFFLQTMTNLRKEVCGLFMKSFQMLPTWTQVFRPLW